MKKANKVVACGLSLILSLSALPVSVFADTTGSKYSSATMKGEFTTSGNSDIYEKYVKQLTNGGHTVSKGKSGSTATNSDLFATLPSNGTDFDSDDLENFILTGSDLSTFPVAFWEAMYARVEGEPFVAMTDGDTVYVDSYVKTEGSEGEGSFNEANSQPIFTSLKSLTNAKDIDTTNFNIRKQNLHFLVAYYMKKSGGDRLQAYKYMMQDADAWAKYKSDNANIIGDFTKETRANMKNLNDATLSELYYSLIDSMYEMDHSEKATTKITNADELQRIASIYMNLAYQMYGFAKVNKGFVRNPPEDSKLFAAYQNAVDAYEDAYGDEGTNSYFYNTLNYYDELRNYYKQEEEKAEEVWNAVTNAPVDAKVSVTNTEIYTATITVDGVTETKVFETQDELNKWLVDNGLEDCEWKTVYSYSSSTSSSSSSISITLTDANEETTTVTSLQELKDYYQSKYNNVNTQINADITSLCRACKTLLQSIPTTINIDTDIEKSLSSVIVNGESQKVNDLGSLYLAYVSDLYLDYGGYSSYSVSSKYKSKDDWVKFITETSNFFEILDAYGIYSSPDAELIKLLDFGNNTAKDQLDEVRKALLSVSFFNNLYFTDTDGKNKIKYSDLDSRSYMTTNAETEVTKNNELYSNFVNLKTEFNNKLGKLNCDSYKAIILGTSDAYSLKSVFTPGTTVTNAITNNWELFNYTCDVLFGNSKGEKWGIEGSDEGSMSGVKSVPYQSQTTPYMSMNELIDEPFRLITNAEFYANNGKLFDSVNKSNDVSDYVAKYKLFSTTTYQSPFAIRAADNAPLRGNSSHAQEYVLTEEDKSKIKARGYNFENESSENLATLKDATVTIRDEGGQQIYTTTVKGDELVNYNFVNILYNYMQTKRNKIYTKYKAQFDAVINANPLNDAVKTRKAVENLIDGYLGYNSTKKYVVEVSYNYHIKVTDVIDTSSSATFSSLASGSKTYVTFIPEYSVSSYYESILETPNSEELSHNGFTVSEGSLLASDPKELQSTISVGGTSHLLKQEKKVGYSNFDLLDIKGFANPNWESVYSFVPNDQKWEQDHWRDLYASATQIVPYSSWAKRVTLKEGESGYTTYMLHSYPFGSPDPSDITMNYGLYDVASHREIPKYIQILGDSSINKSVWGLDPSGQADEDGVGAALQKYLGEWTRGIPTSQYDYSVWVAQKILGYVVGGEGLNSGYWQETTGASDGTVLKPAMEYYAAERLGEPFIQFTNTGKLGSRAKSRVLSGGNEIDLPLDMNAYTSVQYVGSTDTTNKTLGLKVGVPEAILPELVWDHNASYPVANTHFSLYTSYTIHKPSKEEQEAAAGVKEGVKFDYDFSTVNAWFTMLPRNHYWLDYQIWASKTTESTGLVMASWVDSNRERATVDLNGYINIGYSSDRSKLNGSTGMNQHNYITGTVEQATLGRFADYIFKKDIIATDYVYCEKHNEFIPVCNLNDHRYVYYTIGAEIGDYTTTTSSKSKIVTPSTADSFQNDLTLISNPYYSNSDADVIDVKADTIVFADGDTGDSTAAGKGDSTEDTSPKKDPVTIYETIYSASTSTVSGTDTLHSIQVCDEEEYLPLYYWVVSEGTSSKSIWMDDIQTIVDDLLKVQVFSASTEDAVKQITNDCIYELESMGAAVDGKGSASDSLKTEIEKEAREAVYEWAGLTILASGTYDSLLLNSTKCLSKDNIAETKKKLYSKLKEPKKDASAEEWQEYEEKKKEIDDILDKLAEISKKVITNNADLLKAVVKAKTAYTNSQGAARAYRSYNPARVTKSEHEYTVRTIRGKEYTVHTPRYLVQDYIFTAGVSESYSELMRRVQDVNSSSTTLDKELLNVLGTMSKVCNQPQIHMDMNHIGSRENPYTYEKLMGKTPAKWESGNNGKTTGSDITVAEYNAAKSASASQNAYRDNLLSSMETEIKSKLDSGDLDEKVRTWYYLENPHELLGFTMNGDEVITWDQKFGTGKTVWAGGDKKFPDMSTNLGLDINVAEAPAKKGPYTMNLTTDGYSYNALQFEQMLIAKNIIDGDKTWSLSDVFAPYETYGNATDSNLKLHEKPFDGSRRKRRTEYVTSTDKYNLKPEFMMVYKTYDITYATDKDGNYLLNDDGKKYFVKTTDVEKKGLWEKVYMAGYNTYTADFPMYCQVNLNYDPEVKSVATGTANTAAAKELQGLDAWKNTLDKSKALETYPVVYTGTEMNTIFTDNNNPYIEFDAYVLAPRGDAANVAKLNAFNSWNEGKAYSDITAAQYANSWLDMFKNTDKTAYSTLFKFYATFADSDTGATINNPPKSYNDAPSIDGKAHTRIEQTVELELGKGMNDNLSMGSDGDIDIEFQDGRLAYVYVPANLLTGGSLSSGYDLIDGKYKVKVWDVSVNTSEDLKSRALADNSGGFSIIYKVAPDIIEAIYNMKLVEMSKTLFINGSNAGTQTTWNSYNGLKQYKDNQGFSMSNTSWPDTSFISDWCSANLDLGETATTNLFNVHESHGGTALSEKLPLFKPWKYSSSSDVEADMGSWYEEGSTILTIKKFSARAEIPTQLAASWKIPASYGYNSPTNKKDLFATKKNGSTISKQGIGVWAEAAFDFQNAPEIPGVDKRLYTTGSLDFVGNEKTGANYDGMHEPELQCIIHNASVNDMYN